MNVNVTAVGGVVAVEGTAVVLVQNLGPDLLYFDTTPDVTVASGAKVLVGGDFSTASHLGLGGGRLYLASAGVSDVRIVKGG